MSEAEKSRWSRQRRIVPSTIVVRVRLDIASAGTSCSSWGLMGPPKRRLESSEADDGVILPVCAIGFAWISEMIEHAGDCVQRSLEESSGIPPR